jgi:CelD/BcsL family acetyltransferase involved in cellulose biosynthesis
MTVRQLSTVSALDSIRDDWDRLADASAASVFCSHEYTRAAWLHFAAPGDTLSVFAVEDGSSLLALAPMYVTPRTLRGLDFRVLRWIATWEGDRPQLLAVDAQERHWDELIRFVTINDVCDVLELVEQPLQGPESRGWSFLTRPRWYWESGTDAVDYYVALSGTWDEYVAALSGNTRKQWRQKSRRLAELPGAVTFEEVVDPARVAAAVTRYVALEESGWKAGSGVGVARTAAHQGFYAGVLQALASRGQARLHFLTSSGADIAGSISLSQGGVFYHWHTAYRPEYSALSPGILLQAEMMRGLFGGRWREFDMLSLREQGTLHRHKTDWATGRRQTVRWTGYRIAGRSRLIVLGKKIKRRLRSTLLRRGGVPQA